jgi:NodT family efflux transporter outer membrane factor (OMF) lipoprotein
MDMKRTTLLYLGTALIALSACTTSVPYEKPEMSLPKQWSVNVIKVQNDTPSQARATDWWKSFNNEELDIVITRALANNTGLAASIQKVAQARASLKKTGASLLPSADLSGGASRAHNNPSSGDSTYSSKLSTGVNVSYELDLFGSNRASVEGAAASLEATTYDLEALSLIVIGDVAESYFTLANLRERLDIADKNLKNSKEILRIIDARVREGSESDLELAQQKTSVASAEASRASIEEKIKNAENALAVLLGQIPQTLDIKQNSLKDVIIPDIALVQPSSLLESRPDIRAAEANLKGANADISVAKAAFYPSISLGLSDSLSASGFGDPTATILSLASSLTAPLFSGGELEGSLENATARQKELVQTYHQTVLTSFQEVEDALAAMDAAQKRETFFLTAMENAARAYDISKSRYEAGSIDFQTLLDTQTTLLSSEDSFSQVRLERLKACINLFKAMGGGVDLISE